MLRSRLPRQKLCTAPSLAMVIGALLLLPAPAPANPLSSSSAETLPITGEEALAGATGSSVGAPAVFANPAGLPEKLQVGLAGTLYQSRYRHAGVESEHAGTTGPKLGLVAAMAVPLAEHWSVAFGYRLDHPIHAELPSSPDETRAHAIRFVGQTLHRQDHRFNWGASWRTRTLAVGAMIELTHSTLTLRRPLWLGTAVDKPQIATTSFDLPINLSGHGLAVAGRLGLLWRPAWWLSGGITITTRQKERLVGDLALGAPSSLPTGVQSIRRRDGSFTLRRSSPWSGTISAAMHLSRGLRLIGALTVSEDTPVSRLTTEASLQTASASRDLPPLELEPAQPVGLSPHLAISWCLFDGFLLLQGGWAHRPRDGNALSLLHLGAVHRLGFGATIALRRFTIHASIRYEVGQAPVAGGPLNPLIPESTASVLGGELQRQHSSAQLGLSWRY